MQNKRPIKKPDSVKGCEVCGHRQGEFKADTVNPNIIRVYCKARHVEVDAEIMTKDCDFFVISAEYQRPKEDTNRYGL